MIKKNFTFHENEHIHDTYTAALKVYSIKIVTGLFEINIFIAFGPLKNLLLDWACNNNVV